MVRTIPGSPTKWEWSDNGLSLNVTLRPGVTLHDGRPLNSSTVAEILRAIVDERRQP